MRSKNAELREVVAIFCSDLHLSLKPPIWRSAEPNWLSAQARPLEEVRDLQEKYECPVICAGDVFDRSRKIADGWNAPAELINFAIDQLPDMYAIPGQHDLPNHQYEDIHRSAYWTLVEAGKIKNILPGDITIADDANKNKGLVVSGFPPGYKIKPPQQCHDIVDGWIDIAVIHDYIWIPGYSYPKAPDENKVSKNLSLLEGYDIAVYGDNHKGFYTNRFPSKDPHYPRIFNCGTLMRRKSDEIDYKPQVGLLMSDGSVTPYYLDISQDKYIPKAEEQVKAMLDMGEFFDELEKLGKTALDFVEAMKEFLHRGKTSTEAKQIILDTMESKKH